PRLSSPPFTSIVPPVTLVTPLYVCVTPADSVSRPGPTLLSAPPVPVIALLLMVRFPDPPIFKPLAPMLMPPVRVSGPLPDASIVPAPVIAITRFELVAGPMYRSVPKPTSICPVVALAGLPSALGPAPISPMELNSNVPTPVCVVLPEYVFAPVSVNVRLPDIVTATAAFAPSWITPPNVKFAFVLPESLLIVSTETPDAALLVIVWL